ncbi:hypothetical protein DUI87_07508 [Hirundo rustica rustica]|uniref:Vexin n=1 Tax=Hirundo rustica rustica TaxID=333673 RepID=A0A3M0KPY0_HIRRU|nr:hypothetical protein DUI87_07508 [Hirundo rustica rustica]
MFLTSRKLSIKNTNQTRAGPGKLERKKVSLGPQEKFSKRCQVQNQDVAEKEPELQDWSRDGRRSGWDWLQVGITEQESSKSYNHLLDGKSLIAPSPVAHITVKAVAVTGSPTRNRTSLEDHRQHWRKTTEYDLALPPGAEASLPLTGGNMCGTPSLLRKMWMKHKKKSEYLGATNSAFEAD